MRFQFALLSKSWLKIGQYFSFSITITCFMKTANENDHAF